MTVHRLALYQSSDPFTRIPNAAIRDAALDLKARGLLLVMLSKPDGWAFRERALAAECSVSRQQVRTALATLVEAGYVQRVTTTRDGRPVVETRVFDVAQREGPRSVPDPVRNDDGPEPVPVSNERERATNKRERDLLWETIVRVCGHDPQRLTSSERGRTNKAVSMLREVGATPDEIESASRRWTTLFPGATLTPTALAAHWTRLLPTRSTPETCRDCGQTLDAHDQQLHDIRIGDSRW